MFRFQPPSPGGHRFLAAPYPTHRTTCRLCGERVPRHLIVSHLKRMHPRFGAAPTVSWMATTSRDHLHRIRSPNRYLTAAQSTRTVLRSSNGRTVSTSRYRSPKRVSRRSPVRSVSRSPVRSMSRSPVRGTSTSVSRSPVRQQALVERDCDDVVEDMKRQVRTIMEEGLKAVTNRSFTNLPFDELQSYYIGFALLKEGSLDLRKGCLRH